MKKYSLKRRKTKKKGGSKDILKRAKDIGAEELFKRLLYWDPNINDAEELHLYEASANNNVELVRLLLDIGADINLANRDGETPLYVASLFGYVKMVRILAERGANINKANNVGATPLWIASAQGNEGIVIMLVENRADINKATNSAGDTPLYVASEMGYVEVVRILLENGADINKAESNGQTPLMIAVSAGHSEVVEALLEYGANINAKTNEGYTAFDMVYEDKFPEIATLLKTSQQKSLVTKNIRGYKRPNNISTLRSLAFNNLNTEDTRIINENKLFQPGELGGKRKTRKFKKSKKNKKTRSKKRGGKDGSINHSYKVIEKYKTRIDSENANPFPYYNYYFNTIHELLQYENNLRRNNRTANIIRENTSEFRIIYMTLHVFLRSNTFVDGLVNENKIDDVMLTMKLLIPLTNESEKNRILEFFNQEDYNMELKLSSIREDENRSEFPEIVKEKLDEYKNEFISIIGV